MAEIQELSALELGRAMRAGEVSPAEAARHYLYRIRAIDGDVGAFVTVAEDLAME